MSYGHNRLVLIMEGLTTQHHLYHANPESSKLIYFYKNRRIILHLIDPEHMFQVPENIHVAAIYWLMWYAVCAVYANISISDQGWSCSVFVSQCLTPGYFHPTIDFFFPGQSQNTVSTVLWIWMWWIYQIPIVCKKTWPKPNIWIVLGWAIEWIFWQLLKM